ncbi:MAG: hypothetical protein KIT48_07590 [Pseudolabrys sp.]|nr:hypothetical protein [Pseudolabrys sp.]
MTYGTAKVSTLDSAERILESNFSGKSVPITLIRENEAGVIFMTCDELPELFLAVTSDDEIRPAIDRGLRNAFCKEGREVSVYTNGSISGPQIGAMVRVVPAA